MHIVLPPCCWSLLATSSLAGQQRTQGRPLNVNHEAACLVEKAGGVENSPGSEWNWGEEQF